MEPGQKASRLLLVNPVNQRRLSFCFLLNPVICIHKGFNPRSYLILALALCGIETTLPGEECTLKVRHHGQMAAIGGADSGGAEIAAVGIGGIAFVRILQHYVVVVLASGQLELAFAVSHPDAQAASTKLDSNL